MAMKLAPTTIARAAPAAAAMTASQSLHERRVNTPGSSAPGASRRRGRAPVAMSTASGVMLVPSSSSSRRDAASRLATPVWTSSMSWRS